MCMIQNDWNRCVEFHGHSCPGLAIGYRTCEAVGERGKMAFSFFCRTVRPYDASTVWPITRGAGDQGPRKAPGELRGQVVRYLPPAAGWDG